MQKKGDSNKLFFFQISYTEKTKQARFPTKNIAKKVYIDIYRSPVFPNYKFEIKILFNCLVCGFFTNQSQFDVVIGISKKQEKLLIIFSPEEKLGHCISSTIRK